MPSDVDSTWMGDDILERVMKACGRAAIGMGMYAVQQAKEFEGDPANHMGLPGVVTGTLRRSIHVAAPEYTGGADQMIAETGSPDDDGDGLFELPTVEEVVQGHQAVVLMGSWVLYAANEEEDREHQFLEPAVDMLRDGPAEEIVMQAFDEEGLTGHA
jgi:hypothetical protein